MKATTFVLRQHERIDEMLRVLERERHLRAPMLTELVEEILSFLALEEDFFYPQLAARVRDPEATSMRELRDCIAREQSALLELVGAESEDEFAERVGRLGRALEAHARSDRAIVPLVERAIDERELEDMGARMARFYRESVGAARGAGNEREGNVTIH